jgi:hypothetical protein
MGEYASRVDSHLEMLIRGLVLLAIVSVALFVAARTVLKSDGAPAVCDSTVENCVPTNAVHPGR